MRRLTLLGLLAVPKYGGNRDYLVAADRPGGSPRLDPALWHYDDFIVLESASSGSIVARQLSRASHSVVLMQQGSRMAGRFARDEVRYRQLSGITNNPGDQSADFPARRSEGEVQPAGATR